MCGSDSTNSLTLELNLFSSIKLFIYCSEQTTCSILIRHVVVVLSHILSLVSPALWRQWLGGDLQRVRWCDLHPRTANNFHGTVMSRLKFTELHATVHRVSTSNCCCYIAVKLSWKTQKLDGCGLGSSTRPGQGRPSTAPQWTRGREQWGHVSTWPARGHNCVIPTQRWTPACLGWPVSYIIFYWGGQCGNTSPHPSPRPVPGGTCWLQNPRSGRCNTRYTASVSAALMLLQTTVSYKV